MENSRSRDSFCDGSIASDCRPKQSPQFLDVPTLPLAGGACQPFRVGRGFIIGAQNDTTGHALAFFIAFLTSRFAIACRPDAGTMRNAGIRCSD